MHATKTKNEACLQIEHDYVKSFVLKEVDRVLGLRYCLYAQGVKDVAAPDDLSYTDTSGPDGEDDTVVMPAEVFNDS